ncbi:hypothetical protein FA95DRAFT_1610683, partial [Auriscalpium vulgare]
MPDPAPYRLSAAASYQRLCPCTGCSTHNPPLRQLPRTCDRHVGDERDLFLVVRAPASLKRPRDLDSELHGDDSPGPSQRRRLALSPHSESDRSLAFDGVYEDMEWPPMSAPSLTPSVDGGNDFASRAPSEASQPHSQMRYEEEELEGGGGNYAPHAPSASPSPLGNHVPYDPVFRTPSLPGLAASDWDHDASEPISPQAPHSVPSSRPATPIVRGADDWNDDYDDDYDDDDNPDVEADPLFQTREDIFEGLDRNMPPEDADPDDGDLPPA